MNTALTAENSKCRSLSFSGIPRYAVEPLLTEALLEAACVSPVPNELSARILPLAAPGEDEVSGILTRVYQGTDILHQRPYSVYSWCLSEWIKEKNGQGQAVRLTTAPGTGLNLSFALPEVCHQALDSLLQEGSAYGTPGIWPAVLDAGAWAQIAETFEKAHPAEAMVLLRGSLCRCTKTGLMYTHITGVDKVEAKSAPDAVAATSSQVVDAFGQNSGQFLGIAHSHPVQAAQGKVVISDTDLTTFRRHLRSAHMVSLIANVAPGLAPEAVALSWNRGSPVSSGFYIANGGGS